MARIMQFATAERDVRDHGDHGSGRRRPILYDQ
jgi:hypothetical protein